MTKKLIITERAMVSSLGGDADACAAHRAGITRPKGLSLLFGTEDDPDPAPVIGYPCEPAETFEGYGRLAYLLYLAIADLIKPDGRDLTRLKNSGIIIVLPCASERPLLADQEMDLQKDGDSLFISMLYNLIPDWKNIPILQIVRDGHAGAFHAVDLASDMMARKKIESCFVAAVDSYIDLPSLEWLFSTGQLKSPVQTEGLMPGESACIILIENEVPKSGCARIFGVACGDENHDYGDSRSVFAGEALFTLSQKIFSGGQNIDDVYLISDHNGQNIRAAELGNFLVKLKAGFPMMKDFKIVAPAESFGDVGAATGLVLICAAINALERGYAPAKKAFVTTASYSGKRSCLLLALHAND
jgi:3-oxoacyl-[acyl-carrier-protein] synthase I